MHLLVVSQNRVVDQNKREYLDCVDPRLADFLLSLPCESVTLSNTGTDVNTVMRHIRPHGIVLSGGNNIGEEPKRDSTEIGLLDYAADVNIPVLGICRAMQMINHYLGGSIVGVSGHAGTAHPIRSDDPSLLEQL